MAENDLISRSALIKHFAGHIREAKNTRDYDSLGTWRAALFDVQDSSAVDAVTRDEYDLLLKRFRHLLESDYIRSFDEYDRKTGTYKRDILEAVEPMLSADDRARLDNVGKWLEVLSTETVQRFIDVLERCVYDLNVARGLDAAREKIRNMGAPEPPKEE